MLLRVTHVEMLTPNIRLIRLQNPDGSPLPSFKPGAHIEVGLPLGEAAAFRKYSLVSDGGDGTCYEIAVKRNAFGRGGSVFLNDALSIGDELEVSAPINEFGIASAGLHHVLIAGGIGITPMLGIASRLKQAGMSYELHYAAMSRGDMAFHDALLRDHAGRCTLYFTREEPAQRLDVQALVAHHRDHVGTHLYVCGPGSLIDEVRLSAEGSGLARPRVHFESFGPAWSASDGTVRVTMTESALDLEVEPGTTLLEAMEAAGAWIPSDCKRGECGACIASYTGGRPLHRDNCLTEAQRAHSFCPCVSWASSDAVLLVQM
ncbi:PDR/VanB family oxidoreductase [Paucibacter sp. R3-3]|uniref:PDR/VanB family oxidoreductase n=1 Tax=Roseateles agri TaxID=3098619 RepID=A0ABU5DKE4_9BURK|nr:PDR/VanB family oxidoreductase [Paucibacter sp. R3-3]MDY0746767.1 PDR/VanB family oxidoreductase [Paucibacter sp. R3-3]